MNVTFLHKGEIVTLGTDSPEYKSFRVKTDRQDINRCIRRVAYEEDTIHGYVWLAFYRYYNNYMETDFKLQFPPWFNLCSGSCCPTFEEYTESGLLPPLDQLGYMGKTSRFLAMALWIEENLNNCDAYLDDNFIVFNSDLLSSI